MMASLKRQVLCYPAEMLCNLARCILEMGLLAWFFYRSPWALIALLPLGLRRFWERGHCLEQKKKKELDRQFQECMLSVSAGLRAGYSVENAFGESRRDMQTLFGEKSRIAGELEEIGRGMQNNIPLVRMLKQLGERSGSAYIREFAEILSISTTNGGNLTEVIGSTAEMMNVRLQTVREIEDAISGRKLEARIMTVIPFLLITYVQMGNRGYFDMLYHNGTGVCIMTVCLAVYVSAVWMTEKMTDIHMT